MPSWDQLYEVAASHAGHFSTAEAEQAGFSSQLLHKHERAGRIRHVRRGVFRLVHFPASDHEDLAVLWLWSEQTGVFSHDTALLLQDLGDVLPNDVHLTLPSAWRSRRIAIPEGVMVHYSDVVASDRQWMGPVPVTTPRRTLVDCVHAHLSPDLLSRAARDAVQRGLVSRSSIPEVETALAPFGGF